MPIGRLNTNQSKVSVPIGAFADKLMQYGRQQEAKVLQEQQMANEDERFQTNLGFKNRQEDRLTSKIQSDKDKELANNEAMSAILHPEKYSQEQRASILGNSHVDQSKLFNTETALYKRNVMTPGTAEYKALKLANRDEKRFNKDLDWKYAKKIEDYNFDHKQTLQKARSTRADNKIKQARADKANLAKVYKDMLNVSPTQQVDKVVNQAAIDSAEEGQLKYGKAYSEFMKKANYDSTFTKSLDLTKKLSTSTDPKAKAQLQEELNIVSKKLIGLETAANQIGNNAIGSIGLQPIPEAVVRQETEQKPREQFIKELTGIIPEDLASADIYKAAESRLNKFFKPVDPTAEGFKQAIKTYGGEVPKTNDPKVLEAVAKSILKQNEKKVDKKADRDYKKSIKSTKATTMALDSMVSLMGSPDVVGQGDVLDMYKSILKDKLEYKVPEDVSSQWLNTDGRVIYNDTTSFVGVNEGGLEDAYKAFAKKYAEDKKKPEKK